MHVTVIEGSRHRGSAVARINWLSSCSLSSYKHIHQSTQINGKPLTKSQGISYTCMMTHCHKEIWNYCTVKWKWSFAVIYVVTTIIVWNRSSLWKKLQDILTFRYNLVICSTTIYTSISHKHWCQWDNYQFIMKQAVLKAASWNQTFYFWMIDRFLLNSIVIKSLSLKAESSPVQNS